MQGTVRLENEFTIGQIAERNDDLIEAVKNWDEVIVDMSELKRLDVAALQVLIAAKKECDKLGHSMIFLNSNIMTDMLLSTGTKL